MGYTLAYKDRFYSLAENMPNSSPASPHCGDASFGILNEGINRLQLSVTAQEMRWIFDSATQGAMLLYPEQAQTVMEILLKAIDCPPDFPPESDGCLNYLPYAPFLSYSPQNPYTQPEFTPPNYAVPPFHANSDGEYPLALGYLLTDVMTPISAINLNPIDILTFNFPTITIQVIGSGQIELDLLAIQAGGLAVIKVGSPPNLYEIIVEGIIGSDIVIVDLNNDTFALPPESDIVVSEEINVNAGVGISTNVYIVFIPAVDDAIIPLRYGGGIRQIGLCGFEGIANMGITDIRFNAGTCNLEVLENGSWSVVNGWENWLSCVPSGGGGSGGANIITTPFTITDGTQASSNNTAYDGVYRRSFSHTFTKSKALIVYNVAVRNNVAGEDTYIRPIMASGTRVSFAEGQARQNTVNPNLMPSAYYENIVAGTHNVGLEARTSAGGTWIITLNIFSHGFIIEFDDASDLYVTAVRIQNRELQYQIAGAWITASDSLAGILNGIEATANNALAAANSAIAVNNSQQTQINGAITVNNQQNTRLTNLETNVNGLINIDIPQINARIDDHEARLDVLEALSEVSNFGGVWAWLHDMTLGSGGYSSPNGNVYSAGVGWQSNSNGLSLLRSAILFENQITHIEATIIFSAAPTGTPEWRINGSSEGRIANRGIGVESKGWLRVPNSDSTNITIDFLGFGSFVLTKLRYLGRGNDIPFD